MVKNLLLLTALFNAQKIWWPCSAAPPGRILITICICLSTSRTLLAIQVLIHNPFLSWWPPTFSWTSHWLWYGQVWHHNFSDSFCLVYFSSSSLSHLHLILGSYFSILQVIDYHTELIILLFLVGLF